MVEQPVLRSRSQQRPPNRARHSVAKPLAVGGGQQGPALVAQEDWLGQVHDKLAVKRTQTKVIEKEQLDARPAEHLPVVTVVGAGGVQSDEEVTGSGVATAVGAVPQGLGRARLVGTRAAAHNSLAVVVFCENLSHMGIVERVEASPIPASLQKALADRVVIPFVGAGVSRSVVCRNSGRPLFPSWVELLQRAADTLEREDLRAQAMIVRGMLDSNPPEYLNAARRAKEQLGARWTDFLRDQFDLVPGAAVPDSLELARRIWSLGSKLIVTTNYDHVLRWACASPLELAAWGTNPRAELAKLHRGFNVGPGQWPKRPTAWHIHGHIDAADELILAPDGYSRLYSSAEGEEGYRAALDTLRHLLLGRTFVFIGFSLDDVFFTQTLRSVHETYAGGGTQHFALIREAEAPNVAERVRGLPVQLIRFRDFGAPLLALLGQLRACVAPEAPSAPAVENAAIQALAAVVPPSAFETAPALSADSAASPSNQMEHNTVTPRDLSGANTQLAGHFLELTPQNREDIAKRLGLLPPDYQSLGRIELAKRIFGAARQNHRLADLWTAVEQIHPEGRPLPNPYAT